MSKQTLDTPKPSNGDKTPETEAPKIDWAQVKPEDVPRQLLDKSQRVRELTRKVQELENDVRVLHRGFARSGNIASAIHSVIEPLEDVTTVTNGSLSDRARELVGLPSRFPMPRPEE